MKRLSHYFQTIKPRFWVIFFAGLLIVLIGLYAALQGYISRQQATIEALEVEYAQLRTASAELQNKIDYTYTDEYLEREARKYGLIREGDTLFQLSGAGGGE